MIKQLLFLFIIAVVAGALLRYFTVPGLPPAAIMGYGLGFGILTVMISFVISSIPASIYWLFTGHRMPGYIETVWVLWFIIAAILVAEQYIPIMQMKSNVEFQTRMDN